MNTGQATNIATFSALHCIHTAQVRRMNTGQATNIATNSALHCTHIAQVRRMNTGQATNIAMHTALDKAGVQDDITVVVVDLVPNANDRWVCICVGAHTAVCLNYLNQ